MSFIYLFLHAEVKERNQQSAPIYLDKVNYYWITIKADL